MYVNEALRWENEGMVAAPRLLAKIYVDVRWMALNGGYVGSVGKEEEGGREEKSRSVHG